MNSKFISEFKNPTSEYKSAPFWAWNGDLQPEELRRQIRIMKQMGMGGFFMHSRTGLKTEYLGDKWFECVDACIDEAQKLDMKAWLYDEDRWPSGFAGGFVTENPKYRQKYIQMDLYENAKTYKKLDNLLALYAAIFDGEEITSTRKLKSQSNIKLKKGEKLISIITGAAIPSPGFNQQTYVDTLSHEAIEKFVETTHKKYAEKCGEHFGKLIPGIFTDEPNCGTWSVSSRPIGDRTMARVWTTKFSKHFKQRYGYDINKHLLDLFFDVKDSRSKQVRWHYQDCLTFLFADAFSGTIGRWCEENNMLSTGHALCEDSPISQALMAGSCMRFYEYMQAPGMDLLTEYARQIDTAKQVSSAARQFNRKWRITETYGCTGWAFPLAGHKALSDWQAAMGINLRCQHLSWYTMAGQAKRDYPAGIFDHSPWWDVYPVVEDYYARVHAAMTKGVEIRDVLVIHPNESIFLYMHKDLSGCDEAASINHDFIAIRDNLLTNGIDFDYGDEDIIARHGRVTGRADKATFKLAKADYKVVIVPHVDTIRSTTLALLEKFIAAGGQVVFAGKAPKMVDAIESDAAIELAKNCDHAPLKSQKLIETIEARSRRVNILDGKSEKVPSALFLLRRDSKQEYLFICNTGHDMGLGGKGMEQKHPADIAVSKRTKSYPEVTITAFADSQGKPLELDPHTGEIFETDSTKCAEGWNIKTSLAALESRIFVAALKKESSKKYPKRPACKKTRKLKVAPASDQWDIALDEANVMVLDTPRYKIGTGKMNAPLEILRIDAKVHDKLGIPHRGGKEKQPWCVVKKDNPKSCCVELLYTFNVKQLPSGSLSLGIENPQAYKSIEINSNSLNSDCDSGWWVDRSLRTLPVDTAFISLGKNTLKLVIDYDEYFDGFEIVYLLGNFGVKLASDNTPVMTAAPTTLTKGNWTKQGLPFYSGRVGYIKKIRPKLKNGERVFVTCPDYDGSVIRILVNGKAAGVIAWDYADVDITDFLDADGSATLCVQVISHRRNSHGPLHLKELHPYWTGPGQFVCEDKEWSDKPVLQPCGLNSDVTLEIRS